MRSLAVLAGIAATAISLAQFDTGAPTPEELASLPTLLRKAIANANKIRYTGTRIVEFRRPQPETHTEYITRDGTRVRVDFPTGSSYSGQVVVEDGGQRRHFVPEANEIRILPPRREEAFMRLVREVSRGGRAKRIGVAGGETIAGRNTQQIIVYDRDGNVMQRLFLDTETGALLKRQMYDAVGTEVGMFVFTEIDFHPKIARGTFRLERKGAKIVTPYDELLRTADKEGFDALSLPRSTGYKLDFVKTFDAAGNRVLLQVYNSPQAKLSFFQIKGLVPQERIDRFARGDVKVKSWQDNGRTYVLVGALDEEALSRLMGVLRSRT